MLPDNLSHLIIRSTSLKIVIMTIVLTTSITTYLGVLLSDRGLPYLTINLTYTILVHCYFYITRI
jgi:hypothetical protein